jgi:hypothetical protein
MTRIRDPRPSFRREALAFTDAACLSFKESILRPAGADAEALSTPLRDDLLRFGGKAGPLEDPLQIVVIALSSVPEGQRAA